MSQHDSPLGDAEPTHGRPRFYNTLTQRVEPFEPLTPGKASVYLCGLTTYNHAHAGHARAGTAFDVLVRHLRARGFEVTFVRNHTDVDDKILKRAAELGEEPLAFSARMAECNDEELAACGCDAPDHAPKVSEHIPEIIALIETLIEKGVAYASKTPEGEDVYFSVRGYPAYGKLSKRNVDDLLAGARVEVGDVKRDPLDFALWKGCSDDGFGWPSPWGKGRPGWHIECSAMSAKFLGPHYDIHCGGTDLIFPHHENEIAQSEAAWGAPFARYWMHNGMVTVDSEKMSKSLGNFVTVGDVLTRNDAEAFRYFLLGTHYRGPLAFDVEKHEDGRVTFPGVDDAERRVEYLYTTRETLIAAAAAGEKSGNTGSVPAVLAPFAKVVDEAAAKVLDALDRDLNTSQALSVIGELARTGNEIAMQIPRMKKDAAAQASARALAGKAARALGEACRPLGLLLTPPESFAERTRARRLVLRKLDAALVDAKVLARTEARTTKDFARADTLRAELTAMGVEVFDSPTGSTWRVTL